MPAPISVRLAPLAFALSLALAPTVHADVVISQIYGGGGNSGATLRNDFIELHNNGEQAVSLSGWTVQYASASGNSWSKTALTGSIGPGQYYLVQQAAGTGGSQNLPTPDAIGSSAMSSSAGKVALLNHNTALSCSTGCDSQPGVVDFIGFGSANSSETAPTASLNNTTAALRKDQGCTDTGNNQADFSTGAPQPRNSASSHVCTDGGGGGGETPPPVATRIRDIQGIAHRSPKNGQAVSNVPGIVTLLRSNGFFMQDSVADADPRTSEGLFVYTGSAPQVQVGDQIHVSGSVTEFRPGGSGGSNNLSITEITSPQIQVLVTGQTLPEPVLIGAGGRVAPTQKIAPALNGDVETLSALDLQYGLDFYESLEGMRVRVSQARASGPTNRFGEVPVLPDAGVGADLLSARGGIVIRENDFNPERIHLLGAQTPLPSLNVGDSLSSVTGVFDYSFGNYKLLVDAQGTLQSGGLQAETARSAFFNETSVAAYNVENLSAQDPDSKFTALATQIVQHLRSPDLLALMEVQDDNGPTNDSVVSAQQTAQKLIAAISTQGGPAYRYLDIAPVDDQDGGQPGGNIRQGFLFNPAQVQFVARGQAGALDSTEVQIEQGQPTLTLNPGRIQPTDSAFVNSRKPLAAEFLIKGQRVFVIANHFNSKGGDQPLFGRFQAPTRSSEVQRTQQAQAVAQFTKKFLDADVQARVIVLGDINDFQFSDTMQILNNVSLRDLIDALPEHERYSYVFEGNAQALDHILVSPALHQLPHEYDVVHVNSEFATQTSDHDPEVARFVLPLVGSEVTASFSVLKSGVTLNRLSNVWQGTLKLSAKTAINEPMLVLLKNLPAGVRLRNADTLVDGVPALRLAPLAAGQTITLTLQFDNPARVGIGYTPVIIRGLF